MSDETETIFLAQYEHLPNDVLRSIVRGDVPWAESGQFVYAARRAARRLLIERGAEDIPDIPAWDPAAPAPPLRFRLAVVALALLIAGGAAAAWRAADPVDTPGDDEVCQAARELLTGDDFGYQVKLAPSGCRVARDAARSLTDGTVIPVRMNACITLDDNLLGRLKARGTPLEIARVKAYADRPVPGRHCLDEPRTLAELVVRPNRPWFVRIPPGAP